MSKIHPKHVGAGSSSRGNALLAVLVAVAILGITLQGIMTAGQVARGVERNLTSATSAEDLRRLVSLSLLNKPTCDSFVVGKSFDPTPATLADQNIDGLELKSLDGILLAGAGMPLGNRQQVDDLSLTDFRKLSNTRYLASVAIRTAQDKGLTRTRAVTVGIETTAISPTRADIAGCFDTTSPAPSPGTDPEDEHWWIDVSGPVWTCSAPGLGGGIFPCKRSQKNPEELCQAAGFRKATGMCKGKKGPVNYYGATIATTVPFKWNIACYIGYTSLDVQKIACE